LLALCPSALPVKNLEPLNVAAATLRELLRFKPQFGSQRGDE